MNHILAFVAIVLVVGQESEAILSFVKCPNDKAIDQMCPPGWIGFRQKCYFFEFSGTKNLQDSTASCFSMGARMLRFDDLRQAEFFDIYLKANAVNKTMQYYTSGRMMLDTFGKYEWSGQPLDKQGFSNALLGLWLVEPPTQDQMSTYSKEKRNIVLSYDGTKYGFLLLDAVTPRGYICEVDQVDVLGITGNTRLINYGQDDINDVQRGPCFLQQPVDPWVFLPVDRGTSQTDVVETLVSLECPVYGNPRPSVKWYRVNGQGQRFLINSLNNTRTAQTGFRLDVFNPNAADDSDGFQCEATNDYGSILSRVAYITFSSVDKFEKTERKRIVQKANVGQTLDCKAPRYKPADSLKFQFYMQRDSRQDEVLPQLRRNTFVSQVRGMLGFSDTSTIDSGDYICMITPTFNNSYGESQKSPIIPLLIEEANQPYQKPLIMDMFPAIAPTSPMRGDNVRIECFAYGSMRNVGLRYSWRKLNGNVPIKAILENYNRVLIIPSVDESDEGVYECSVVDFEDNRAQPRSATLSVRARPYFTMAPEDVYADLDSPAVTILCRASGKPEVSIRWFFNSVPLIDALNAGKLDKSRFKVTDGRTNDGKIIISNVKNEDEGLYGCQVSNSLGTELRYSQLRVLSFVPNFNKYPLMPTEGVVGGNVIVVCNPEGAPNPKITWRFNGADITTSEEVTESGTGSRVCNAKYCKMLNNNLRITNLAAGDEGEYTCVAENKFGKAESTSLVSVMQQLKFTIEPTGRVVQVNTTVNLPCRVQASPHQDVIYRWFFEGTEIRFDRMDMDMRRYEVTRFERPYGRYFGTLRILGSSHEFDGNYTCRAETAIGSMEKWSLIRVAGVPMPNSGVLIVRNAFADNGTYVCWTAGFSHYANITYYVIEVEDSTNKEKWYPLTTISEEQAIPINTLATTLKRRCTNLTSLASNVNYRVRVVAGNEFGVGLPSPPSDSFLTPSTPPMVQVQNVTGGGGKVQTLVIRWKPIPEVYHNAPDFRYLVHYRAPGQKEFKVLVVEESKYKILEPRFNPEDNTSVAYEYTITLPKGTNYIPYEVAVSTRNSLGVGPMSEIKTVYSAEIVPVNVPTDVYGAAVNSTSIEVTWKQPQFAVAEGKILGYRIVYWRRRNSEACKTDQANTDRILFGQRQTVWGLLDSGVVIGLDADQYYCLAVQAFNSAGDGPESSFAEQTTYKLAPQQFPTLVTVNATDIPYTVRVNWVGVQAQPQEESLDGYKIRWWQAGAPLKTAPKDVDCGLSSSGFIYGLSLDTRYNVRVFAYSRGGVGKLSSPMIQFTIVSASKCHKGGTYDGPDIRYQFICSACSVRMSHALVLLALLSGRILAYFW